MFFNPIQKFVEYLKNQKAKQDMGMDDQGFVSTSRLNPFENYKPRVSTIQPAVKNQSGAILEAPTRGKTSNYNDVAPGTDTGKLIETIAAANGLKPSLLAAILLAESSGGENKSTSWAGARGPMQITKIAADAIGEDYNDPRLNELPFALDAGARYLTQRVKQIKAPNDPTAYYTTYNRGNLKAPLDPLSQKNWERSYAEAKRRQFK